MDANEFASACGAVTAVAVAFNTVMQFVLQRQIAASKKISEENATALVGVAALGQDNADAIEHTRVQNVRLASAVEITKVQNDELAVAVGHVHTCVEAGMAEIKETVEKVPDTVKEVVPAAIKEVVPDVIKEGVPQVISLLKE